MQLIEKSAPFTVPLSGRSGQGDRVHEFDQQSVNAVNSALASGRPLLVRGEPGVGKTQLAEAAAEKLERAYVPFVVNARTEARDLLWRFDAVMRLAEAQVLSQAGQPLAEVRKEVAVSKFVRPGPLWWAFDSGDAGESAREDNLLTVGKNDQRSASGWVVLIDEIDKADSDLPNGLLEALGSRSFKPQGRSEPVSIPKGGIPPLVIVTTNEDRVLPDAFIRRCMVLHLDLPTDKGKLVDFLVKRGRRHFQEPDSLTSDDVLTTAANILADDRAEAQGKNLRPLPGQAEYLDLVRAVVHWKGGDFQAQKDAIETVRKFAFQKHRDLGESL